MKPTQTGAVFSRTTMVLFLCRNKSSRNGMTLCKDCLYNKSEFLEPRTTGGGHLGGHNPRGRAPLQAHPGGLSPPGGPADPETDAIKSYFSRKIREKELSRFTIRSRRHLLFFIERPDLESIWGSGEGDLHSSSSPTLLHRNFHDAPHWE